MSDGREPGIRRVFRLPQSARGQDERDVDEELAFHLAMRESRLRAAGLSNADARAEARRRFGEVADVREACLLADRHGSRREWLGTYLDGTLHDLRLAIRSLRHAPAFTLAATLLLALGIGGTIAAYSIVNAIAFRPLPYPHAERLAFASVALDEPGCGRRCVRDPTAAEAEVWATGARSVEAVGSLRLRQGPVRTGDGALVLEGAAVSAPLTRMLGLRTALGRMLDAADFAPAADAVLVLGHATWRTEFGGDPAIVGRVLAVHDAALGLDVPHRVVGVLAPDSELGSPIFSFNERTAQYLLPQRATSGDADAAAGRVLVRARPGVARDRLRAELDLLLRRGDPARDDATVWRAEVEPLRHALAARYQGSFPLLLAAVGVVLLVTCLNVAGLLVARLNERTPELATRTALGATRSQLSRPVVLETLLIAVAGGAAGLLLAQQAIQLTRLIPADRLPFWTGVELDARVAAATVLVTLGVALLLSLAPLALLTPHRLLLRVRELVAASPSRVRTRGVIVATEVALSVVLLSSAALLGKLLVGAERRELGYAKRSVVYVALDRSRAGSGAAESLERVQAATARLAALLGVAAVGVQGFDVAATSEREAVGDDRPDVQATAMRRMLDGSERPAMMVEGRADPLTASVAPTRAHPVTPAYFAARGTPIVQGRAFTDGDGPNAPPVAIVDERTAQRLFPGEGAVGRRVKLGGPDVDGPWLTIVGVVAATRGDPMQTEETYDPTLYRPLAQAPSAPASVLVRTTGDARGMLGPIRRALHDLGPGTTVASVITIEDGLGRRLWPARFNAAVVGAFALFTLTLACLGIYATVRHAVGRRRREMAVRLALGASRTHVVTLVLRAGLRPVMIGLGVGTLGALAAGRVLRALLHGAAPFDPLALAVAAAAMLAAAGIAAYVPARRAAREHPARALRAS